MPITHPKPVYGHSLSPRENEIVELTVNTCMTMQQIAHQLKISLKTVDQHRQHIYDKLGIHCMQELCRWYWNKGAAT